jgi:eukaryotic-like serine/threonine-protein kinase
VAAPPGPGCGSLPPMWQGAGGRLVADRYVLEAVLNGRGLGVVCRARDLAGDRPVALKRLRPPEWLPAAELPSLVAMIRREVAVAATVRHPALAAVFDLVDDGGQPVLVMELVDGVTLHELARRHGPLPPRRAAQLAVEVLAGLDAMHQAGVLHGAVSPGTLLVTPAGAAKLVGLGGSVLHLHPRAIAAQAGASAARVLAPELAAGGPPGLAPFGQVGAAVDVWAAAATLHYATVGRPPSPAGPAPELAGWLGSVLARLLAADPGQRPAAGEAARLLVEAGAGSLRLPAATPAAAQPPAEQPALVPTMAPVAASAPAPPSPAGPAPPADAPTRVADDATTRLAATPPAPARVEQPPPWPTPGGPEATGAGARALQPGTPPTAVGQPWADGEPDPPRDALAVGLIAVFLAVLAVIGVVVGIRVMARLAGADQPETRPRLAAPPTSPPSSRAAPSSTTPVAVTTTTSTTTLAPLRIDREAESASLAGGARPARCNRCSGKTKVGFVGHGGTLTFAGVQAPSLGSYQLTIWYASGERRDALLSVDGGQGIPLSFEDSGGFDRVGRLSVTITLRAGDNTLTFFNPSGFGPDFDRIRVRRA